MAGSAPEKSVEDPAKRPAFPRARRAVTLAWGEYGHIATPDIRFVTVFIFSIYLRNEKKNQQIKFDKKTR